MTAECLRCERPTLDGYACSPCADRAAAQLAEIRDMAPAARDVAYRLSANLSGSGGAGKPGSRLPLDLGATARCDSVANVLGTWTRHVVEERGAYPPDLPYGLDVIPASARFLAEHLEWFRHRAEVDEFLTDVDAAVRVMRGLVRGPGESQFLGICGAMVTWDDEDNELPRDDLCPGHVFGRGKQGTCRACGARWDDVAERLARVDTAVREGLYHASEIADAYPKIRAETIRVWLHRGLLVAHGEHDGRPLFKLGEVLDLAAGDAARREEARATRARRKEQAA